MANANASSNALMKYRRSIAAKLKQFLVSMALFVVFCFGTNTASAQNPGIGEPVTVESACMQDLAGFNLNCTANDIRISGIADLNGDGAPDIEILDDGCQYPGDDVTFRATFEVELSAQERHDIGIYFAIDGDPNGDGALTGSPSSEIPNACSVSSLAYAPDPPWLDLDGTTDPLPGTNTSSGIQDTCGDIADSHSPQYPIITITTKCIDPDGNRMLNLPYCTSWRQPGANELCVSPLDAFPGSPSKCECDTGFEIPIDVPPASLQVTKTANPVSVNEPGGLVTFSIQIANTTVDPLNSIDIDTLTDDVYGDLLDSSNPNVTDNTCLSLDRTIGSEETVSCSFKAQVAGNAGDVVVDTVTASGLDQRDPPNRISGTDDASVTILDMTPAISLVKTANPVEVSEPGDNVTFSIVITNESGASSDPVVIDSLNDSIYGDLTALSDSDCTLPQTIPAGSSYSCSFSTIVSGNAGDFETNTATATGHDDEGNPVSASDSATVNIIDVHSSIHLDKTVAPIVVNEPGGDVTFTFTVTNTSAVDTVTISDLTDNIYGDLTSLAGSTCTTPQEIAPQGSYSCTLMIYIAGNANESITNIATASGLDDDGNPVSATDDATVSIENVLPSAILSKTASMADVTFEVTVVNDSAAEALELTNLVDDIYGDITVAGHSGIISTTCSVPQTLEPKGQVGHSYTCSFQATVSAPGETDTVTGTVSDDDGSTPITPSDSATVSLE